MSATLKSMLADVEKLLDTDLNEEATLEILRVIGGPAYPPGVLDKSRIYPELLPKGREPGFTDKQRHLHFLWESLDLTPLGLIVTFAFPFRRLIAERLFKACGGAFCCEVNVRFNLGQNLDLGDNVFFNRNVFLDTKGGIAIGDSTALAEDVRVFTHSHSESCHYLREYKPVVIESYAKVFAGATILPGVTVGREALVAAGSIVTRDVPPNTVVAGAPAKVVRERKTDGRHGDDLDHIWLF